MTFSRAFVLVALLVAAVPAQAQTPLGVPSRLITVDQVIAMKKAGVSDTVVLALIQRDRPIFIIDATQTSVLTKQGISDALLLAMIATGQYGIPPAFQSCVAAPIAAPPPSSVNGIFFARPTPGIFFPQRPVGCTP